MPLFTDQLNRTIEIASPPKRIVSLVPSQTELLFDLGLGEEVIGITKFCIHPDKWFREKERVGGTKTVHLEKLASLQPDLIIANKEENVKEQVEALADQFPVWISDVNSLEGACQMMERLGEITGKKKEAQTMTGNIKSGFHQLVNKDNKPQTRTTYFIWKDPYITVGGDTFIHHMLEAAGFNNVFESRTRYPQINVEELQSANCHLLLLSSEPYPFQQKHINELQQYLPQTSILLVDGEMFSWYGSRLLKAPAYFRALQNQVSLML